MQARRAKARLKSHKRGAEPMLASDWSEEVLEPESVAAGEPHIVTTETIPVKPMSIDEAMLQLEESNLEFIVFLNASNDKVNVLYRRRDNNLGLITDNSDMTDLNTGHVGYGIVRTGFQISYSEAKFSQAWSGHRLSSGS